MTLLIFESECVSITPRYALYRIHSLFTESIPEDKYNALLKSLSEAPGAAVHVSSSALGIAPSKSTLVSAHTSLFSNNEPCNRKGIKMRNRTCLHALLAPSLTPELCPYSSY